jgi:hypothetical protein
MSAPIGQRITMTTTTNEGDQRGDGASVGDAIAPARGVSVVVFAKPGV